MPSIAENIAAIRERIAAAARRAGRNPDAVTLIAVSKTKPVAAIQAAAAAGIQDIGENRVQEALTKLPHSPPDLRWHLIGHLQSNKAKLAAEHFYLIHTVDSLALAQRLNRLAQERGRPQAVLLQVRLGDEATKSGLSPTDLPSAYAAARGLPHIRIQGLMTIPPFCPDPTDARPYFRQLRLLRDALLTDFPGDQLPELSMGMSHDFEVAIEEGATYIRVGTAIFGER
ncbi:MAG: YggS family pyridoxal phosphate-dependent enzyme [Chloracidobacterium sp.]|uniref:Pyridoxal phosphate homeostasis protein n=1 Tax=Chloracidobacterium validum TaxID=2821543 RepID=A0ABX8BF66_9BACT|nr:YggS family pyridoxal phosphate-dependent enzyme [Chloracidobacterium validum]QUW03720.1 YggS family pyridoxal phosphate-dependent enzyme [Chloracidobacterium validum]